ncbi:hypothetical protein Bca4012_002363 [Brassica carinata]
MLVPSEIEVKHILLSAGVEESIPLMSDLLQGMILSALPWGEHGIISRSYVSDFAKLECSSCSAHVAQFSWWSRRMLLNCSARFIHGWLSLGRERSSSTSSFSNERLIPPTSLFVRGDIIPVCKTGNNYKFPSRLLLCVKARLGPVGATTLIQMRVEVLDGVATSHTIVTNRLLFEDFEMRCKSFIDWIVSGNFDILISISCIKSY